MRPGHCSRELDDHQGRHGDNAEYINHNFDVGSPNLDYGRKWMYTCPVGSVWRQWLDWMYFMRFAVHLHPVERMVLAMPVRYGSGCKYNPSQSKQADH